MPCCSPILLNQQKLQSLSCSSSAACSSPPLPCAQTAAKPTEPPPFFPCCTHRRPLSVGRLHGLGRLQRRRSSLITSTRYRSSNTSRSCELKTPTTSCRCSCRPWRRRLPRPAPPSWQPSPAAPWRRPFRCPPAARSRARTTAVQRRRKWRRRRPSRRSSSLVAEAAFSAPGSFACCCAAASCALQSSRSTTSAAPRAPTRRHHNRLREPRLRCHVEVRGSL